MAQILTQDAPPRIIKIDDVDEPLISSISWRSHRNRPRARLYVYPVQWDDRLQQITVNKYAKQYQIQIPLDRFLFKLTHHNNVKVMHPPGGIPSDAGDHYDCRKRLLRLVPKYIGKSMFIGTMQLTSGYWVAIDRKNNANNILSDNEYGNERDAAKEYDRFVVKRDGDRAETNFYYNLP